MILVPIALTMVPPQFAVINSIKQVSSSIPIAEEHQAQRSAVLVTMIYKQDQAYKMSL